MWIWRRMLRVTWGEKRTNESILQEIEEMRGGLTLLQRTTRHTMMFFVHVMRANGLEKEMMLACGEVGGGGGDGREKSEWRRYWCTGTGMGLEELREVVRNRSAWRMLVVQVRLF